MSDTVFGMLWVFAMIATVGLVVSMPIMVQNWDGFPTSRNQSPVGADTPAPESNDPGSSLVAFAGFTMLGGGLCGMIAWAFEPTATIAAVAALCLGVATGAVHPEVLAWLRRRGETTATSH